MTAMLLPESMEMDTATASNAFVILFFMFFLLENVCEMHGEE
ncbi:hypothetical protein BRYFOR_05811 [Marvinbryantia formatexigens DSM 14469]|uniref:Uncharacterized protein n=1 Tax=Marvinbryantia formatexigens DSM 14469 TaxID=478749 RepID=C6LB17_9FIRM|nr:hypothetical protein BRYFOR_05811 [Marvinbryantia formatexigens DSM 14469]